ncbi:hypothetical protein AVEN_16909-1 [Araneus ventricosus]|uniref:Uncharacterized protein n=1 Tax=Araneus ventricosus TaxID=182803 RepID=A0A4Y2J8H3_ARAVE|nr:hypothetical protein AVEN_16909-1 [Araneus ventricosus]
MKGLSVSPHFPHYVGWKTRMEGLPSHSFPTTVVEDVNRRLSAIHPVSPHYGCRKHVNGRPSVHPVSLTTGDGRCEWKT